MSAHERFAGCCPVLKIVLGRLRRKRNPAALVAYLLAITIPCEQTVLLTDNTPLLRNAVCLLR